MRTSGCGCDSREFWIGLSDMDEQGNWKKWNSGAPVTVSSWDWADWIINRDRHIKVAEHCAEMMRPYWWYRVEWNDLKCDTKRRFVCENTSLTTSSKDVEVVCGDSG